MPYRPYLIPFPRGSEGEKIPVAAGDILLTRVLETRSIDWVGIVMQDKNDLKVCRCTNPREQFMIYRSDRVVGCPRLRRLLKILLLSERDLP